MSDHHSPEPWQDDEYGGLDDANGQRIQQAYEGNLSRSDARRVAACVNACSGIDTELLELVVKHDRFWLARRIMEDPLWCLTFGPSGIKATSESA